MTFLIFIADCRPQVGAEDVANKVGDLSRTKKLLSPDNQPWSSSQPEHTQLSSVPLSRDRDPAVLSHAVLSQGTGPVAGLRHF